MAGRFDFLNPGAMMFQSLQEFLARQDADELRKQQEVRAQADLKLRERGMALDEENAAAIRQQREAAAAELERKTKFANAELLTPGQTLTGRENIPEELTTRQTTLPARTLPMVAGPELSAPMVAPQTLGPVATGARTFTGTPQQQRAEKYFNDPLVPDSIRNYMKARQVAGDENLPYQLFEGVQNKPVVRVSHDRKNLELWNKGKWEPLTGDVPKDAQLIIEPDPEAGQQGDRPYFIPYQSAEGLVAFDTRTGSVGGRLADLKPGETAGKDIANALGVQKQIQDIKKEYDPAKIGVIMGRIKNLDQKYWGSDPDYARFKSMLATLGNTVIQLRTGAQMSIDEAKRIIEEVANEKLPPSSFKARIDRMEELYDQYLANRAKVAYGRTTKEDVDRMVAPGAKTEATDDAQRARDLINKYRK